ncbi:MAG: PP2C family protein-serine/threonine phosphatase [Treponema sp.]|nr:PP2C family protein-serine/threonine phosphatase [Treponema sp.]
MARNKKNIREMSDMERKHSSLSARVYHITIIGTFLMGVLTLIIGISLYCTSLSKKYISTSFNMSRNVGVIIQRTMDISTFANKVMEAYSSQTEAQRLQNGTEQYRKRFKEFESDPDYQSVLTILRDFGTTNTGVKSDVDAIYIGMYDEKNSSVVYIADPDKTDGILFPGQWDKVNSAGIKKFLTWNGMGSLYDIAKTEKYGWMCTSAWPIYDQNGKTVCFVLSDVMFNNIWKPIRSFIIQYAIILFIVVNALGVLYGLRMKKSIVTPINKIAKAASLYVKDRKAGNTSTTYFSSAVVHTGNEIENLSLVMADMEKDLTEYEINLKRVTAEKERISTELSLATRIQADMLPNIYPPFPDRHEFDLYATMSPAREVGGDFYDYFLIDDDHLCMIMADVSGKGIPAALFMMASKIILANNAMMEQSPAEILETTNELICSNNREEMFVTVWLGILEISTGKITAANAGHEYPVIKHPDGQFEVIKDKHGLVIGCMAGMKYQNYELQFEKGSKLFLYTDGVPEATDPDGKMFGMERMVEALNKNPQDPPKLLLEHFRDHVNEFVNGAEQFDDMTMLCFEYKGVKE